MRAVLRLALLTLLTLLFCAEASHAQVDLAKALVGRWEGEQEFLVERSEDPKRTLVIESVTQTDGNWVANGRYGTSAGMGRVRIDVETSGAQPGLNEARESELRTAPWPYLSGFLEEARATTRLLARPTYFETWTVLFMLGCSAQL